MERIGEKMENVITDLSNSRDRKVIDLLNEYPIIMVKAHTRPFERKWMNVVSAIIIPVGVFFYFRMWRFRLRLQRDLKQISATDNMLVERMKEMGY